MANGLILFSTLVVTAVVLQSCSSLPRHYKRSTLQTQGYQHERRQADLSAELSPEEVMEDVDKIMTAVKSEEARVGHALQENELQNLEKKMERLPWYRRFGRWLAHHFNNFTATLKETSGPIIALAQAVTVIATATAAAGG